MKSSKKFKNKKKTKNGNKDKQINRYDEIDYDLCEGIFGLKENTKNIYPYIKFNKDKQFKIENNELEELFKAFDNNYFSFIDYKKINQKDLENINKKDNLMIYNLDIPEEEIILNKENKVKKL